MLTIYKKGHLKNPVFIFILRQVDTSVYTTAPVCKMISYVEMLTALASVINLSAVSLERFNAF